jgi:DNA-directed RNA polymerase subunit RPC12/RpoP
LHSLGKKQKKKPKRKKRRNLYILDNSKHLRNTTEVFNMAEGQFILCRTCNRQVRMEQMTFDKVKNVYICNACYARVNPSQMTTSKSRPSQASKSETSKPSIFGGKKPAEKDVIVKYACLHCKYKWTKKKDKPATKCPYCGGSKIEEVSNEAAKILADSDNFNF